MKNIYTYGLETLAPLWPNVCALWVTTSRRLIAGFEN